MGRLRRLYEAHKDRAVFLFVQVRDGPHALPANLRSAYQEAGLAAGPPDNRSRRLCLATEVMDLPFLSLLDTHDGKVEHLYDAWPERLLVVGRDGRIALDAGRGLCEQGWNYHQIEECLRRLADRHGGS